MARARMIEPIPPLRVRIPAERPVAGDKPHVLYWMTAHRRTRHNFALQHAAWQAERLQKPLLVLEALRVGYPWASDRLHRFVIEGMADNHAAFEAAGVRHFAYLEREAGAGAGLLAALAERACLVVTDDYPCFFLPRMLAAAVESVPARFEAVDANGIVPLAASESAFSRAHGFRGWFQARCADGGPLLERPMADPLARLKPPHKARLPAGVGDRWPEATTGELDGANTDALLAELPIDHAVTRAPTRGGSKAAGERLRAFLEGPKADIDRYAEGRNHPDDDASSGLSPWLHFGHIGAHEIAHAVLEREDWSPDRLAEIGSGGDLRKGSREGWWGLSAGAEAFLDELVIWRELGQHFCRHHPEDYARYASLPSWARKTLEAHADDARPWRYSLAQLEGARTHDDIWNAAQRQLLGEGRMHNYLRMLWGKKILEWSPSPRAALDRMIRLNDKYALDGRDPNSYSGIFWVCGRFDRAWGPERPVYGKVRYMSSDATRRKLKLSGYLDRWSPKGEGG